MSKLKVRSSRTVFTIENEHGEDTGGAVVVSRSRRAVKMKDKRAESDRYANDDRYSSGYSTPLYSEENDPPRARKEKFSEKYAEVTDNFQTVRVIGLPFKAQVFGEDLSPEQAATAGVTEIRDRLKEDLDRLNSIL